ncbi:hypothetical protein BDZ97DRAFT_2054642 [Flammula alnicola]|nr:hypothetical protein BDZ97DRAFT_2054642 [Flammula alnicola]
MDVTRSEEANKQKTIISKNNPPHSKHRSPNEGTNGRANNAVPHPRVSQLAATRACKLVVLLAQRFPTRSDDGIQLAVLLAQGRHIRASYRVGPVNTSAQDYAAEYLWCTLLKARRPLHDLIYIGRCLRDRQSGSTGDIAVVGGFVIGAMNVGTRQAE